MKLSSSPENIPSEYRNAILSQNPDFPRSIFRSIASKEDEEIEEMCAGIIYILETFGEDFDFRSIASWFESERFHMIDLVDFLGCYGVESFSKLRPKIQKLITLSEDKISLGDIFREGYNPEDIINGMLGSLSHGRKTYPESYKDVVRDIVQKTGIITLGHGEQGIFRQILRHRNGTIGYKTYHYDQKNVLAKEYRAQNTSYTILQKAKEEGKIPQYIYPINTIGSLERAKKRNKLGKEVVQNAITLEELQDMNNLRTLQSGDNIHIRRFLGEIKNTFLGLGIKPYDIDTPKNVMVGKETGKKIIDFCQKDAEIVLDDTDYVYPNIDPANWEFFEV